MSIKYPSVQSKMCVTKDMVECSQMPVQTRGIGDSAYTMKIKINTPQQGKPVTITTDSSGKWLGADCGNIKPMVLPK